MSKLSFQSSRLYRYYPHISFVLAMGLLLASAYFYQPQFVGEFGGFYLFLLSLPFIRLSFPLILPSTPSAQSAPRSSSPIRPLWIGVSVVAMILLTITQNPQDWGPPIYETLGLVNTSPHIQMLLLMVGLGSLIAGFGARLMPPRITWQKHHGLLLGILLLALIIRLWNLEYAIHMFIDELLFMRPVNEIDMNKARILLPENNAFADIFSYFQFLVKQLMGPSLTSLRIPSVIFGVLGVAGIYALARQIFSLRVALLSAFLLAILPVHIHFSRMGINNIAGGVMATWCFAYVLRAMRSQRLRDFAITGILLGSTHYFYEGDRIFFTAFFALWMIWIVLFARRDPHFRIPNRKQWVVLIFSVSVVSVPFYHALWSNHLAFARRFNEVRGPDFLVRERLTDFLLDSEIGYIGTPIQRYVQLPIMDNFYQSDYAFVLPYLVPFFLLGFGILLFQIFSVRGALLIWWALSVAIANSFLDTLSAVSPRHIVVYMVLMVFVAIGIDVLWRVLSHGVNHRWRRWMHMGFIVSCIGIGLFQISFYFGEIVPAFHQLVFNTTTPDGQRLLPADSDMMLRAVDLPPDTTLHVFTHGLFSNNLKYDVTFYFGRKDIRVEQILLSDLTLNYFRALPHDRDHVFAFRPFYDDLLPAIQRYFTITRVEGSPFDIPYEAEMYFYYAPADGNE